MVDSTKASSRTHLLNKMTVLIKIHCMIVHVYYW